MGNPGTDRFPARLASLAVIDFICKSMMQAKTSLDLEYDEILIVYFIVCRSTEGLLSDRYKARRYGFEEIALPECDRFCVSMKDIVANLSIPRETVRRKLLILLDRNIIIKTADGYMFPPQLEGTDSTTDFRNAVVESLTKFLARIDMIHQIR